MADYFSFEDVVRELAVSEEELKRMVSEGEIRAFRSGGGMKFRPEDIETMRQGRTSEPTVILPGEPSRSAEEATLDLDIDSEVQALAGAPGAPPEAPGVPPKLAKPPSGTKPAVRPKPPSVTRPAVPARPRSATRPAVVPRPAPPPTSAPEPELELEPLEPVEEPGAAAPPKPPAPKAQPKPAPLPAPAGEEPLELLSEEDVKGTAEPEVELEPELVQEVGGKPAGGSTELDLGDLEVQPAEGEAQETFVEEEGQEVGTDTAPLALADESGAVAEAEEEPVEEARARARRPFGAVAVAEAPAKVDLLTFLLIVVVLSVTLVGFGVTLGSANLRNNIATSLAKWRGDTHWSNPEWKNAAKSGVPESSGGIPQTGGMERVTFTESLEAAPARPGP